MCVSGVTFYTWRLESRSLFSTGKELRSLLRRVKKACVSVVLVSVYLEAGVKEPVLHREGIALLAKSKESLCVSGVTLCIPGGWSQGACSLQGRGCSPCKSGEEACVSVVLLSVYLEAEVKEPVFHREGVALLAKKSEESLCVSGVTLCIPGCWSKGACFPQGRGCAPC